MGDLIERLNDAWRRLYADGDEHGVCDTIAEAAAALEAAREDAERYRWLRGNAVQGRMESRGPRPDFALNCDEPESEWDAAIDQARGEAGGEVEGG